MLHLGTFPPFSPRFVIPQLHIVVWRQVTNVETLEWLLRTTISQSIVPPVALLATLHL